MKQLERLMFIQGGLCYFCKEPLPLGDASVEHLVASGNGGSNSENNCVACCKALNLLLADKALKEKIQVVLNQRGLFKCPTGAANGQSSDSEQSLQAGSSLNEKIEIVVADLQRRGSARPRRVTTLRNTIQALFKKQLTEEALFSLMRHLQERELVYVSGNLVSYGLPPKDV